MAEGFKLTDKQIKYISLFEATSGAAVIDCVDSGEMMVFVVRKGDIGKVLRRHGNSLKRFSSMTKRKIKVVEHSEDPADFIKNAFSPAKITDLRVAEKPDGRKIAVVAVLAKDKGLAIGREGRTVGLIRTLAKRHYDIDQVIVH
ncbi:MAG: NusA-like transcription termination signal-binding factor [Nitrososphaeria archaeon]